jgi:hypothetical protein
MLKDGTEPLLPKLDRIYQEDWRSLNFPITAKLETDQRIPQSKTWSISATLDQGAEGACVGFGFSHDLLAEPQVVDVYKGSSVDNTFAREKVYWEAQKLDDWPGGSYPGATPTYEGSSVLAGAKVLTSYGLYSGYHWGLNLQQVVLGICYDGPAILGIKWYRGMQTPDARGFVYPTGVVDGGHCILANGVVILFKIGTTTKTWANVDLNRSFIKLHNSWGKSWGMRGDCFMTLRDFEKLLNDQGEACFPDRVSVVTPAPAPTPEPTPEVVVPVANTYRSKPSTVEAIQYTGKNFADLLKFAPGRVAHDSKNNVMVRTGVDGKQGWVVIPSLSWIVSNVGDRSDIWAMDSDRFTAVYERNQS